VRSIDEAVCVLEKVAVGELRGRRLQDQRGLVAVEQVPVERREVVRLHANQRGKVAHELVSDQEPDEWRPPAQ